MDLLFSNQPGCVQEFVRIVDVQILEQISGRKIVTQSALCDTCLQSTFDGIPSEVIGTIIQAKPEKCFCFPRPHSR